MTKHELIRAYQEAGWALCKISPNNNTAFENGWNTREGAYTAPGSLDDWHGGIGLLHAYSGTCAIDIDSLKKAIPALARHGIDLPALLRAPGAVIYWRRDPDRLKLFYRLLEPLATVSRGQHGFELRCGTSTGLSAQDVLPPSTREKGFPYEWRTQWLNLPELPAEIRAAWPKAKLLWPQEAAPASPSGAAAGGMTAAAMVGSATNAFEGDRNGWLSGQLFGHLKRGGDYEASLEWLRALNEEKCSPPEDDDKVLKIWRNKGDVEPDPIIEIRTVAGVAVEVPIAHPDLPSGYEWSDMWVKCVDDPAKPVVICDKPLYVQQVLRARTGNDQTMGLDIVVDGVHHSVAADGLYSKLEQTLFNIGVHAGGIDKAKQIRLYLLRFKEFLQKQGKIVDTFSTFGWQADHSFVVGARCYCKDEKPSVAQPAEHLVAMSVEMQVVGTLALWRGAINEILVPENMSQAFAFIMGMAAPLMTLSGEVGGIYSMVGQSGQGKSLVQNAIATMWGDPRAFHTRADDTVNARMIKLSYLSSLPMIAEELTKLEPHDLTNLAYSVSEGRDKERATQDGTLRANVGNWKTLVLASSNRSLLELLLANDAEAAANRLLEDTVTLPKGAKATEGQRLMRILVQNQGTAGHVIAQYIVDNREKLQRAIDSVAARIADQCHASTGERYRVNMLACGLIGLAILQAACGVGTALSMKSVELYALGVLKACMGTQQSSLVDGDEILSAFIRDNAGGTLVMQGPNVTSISRNPNVPLVMRWEKGTHELWIDRAAFNAYLAERKQNRSAFKVFAENARLLKEERKFVLTTGSGLTPTPQRWMYVFHADRLGGVLDVTQDPQSPLTAAAEAIR